MKAIRGTGSGSAAQSNPFATDGKVVVHPVLDGVGGRNITLADLVGLLCVFNN